MADTLFQSLRKSPYFFYIVILVGILLVNVLYVYLTRFERVITIVEKYHYAQGGGRYGLLNNTVIDENGKVYRVANSWLLLEFRSAEGLLSAKPNQKYKVKGYGIRIPALQIFPTIVKLEAA